MPTPLKFIIFILINSPPEFDPCIAATLLVTVAPTVAFNDSNGVPATFAVKVPSPERPKSSSDASLHEIEHRRRHLKKRQSKVEGYFMPLNSNESKIILID